MPDGPLNDALGRRDEAPLDLLILADDANDLQVEAKRLRANGRLIMPAAGQDGAGRLADAPSKRPGHPGDDPG